jgi:hypothetical protein
MASLLGPWAVFSAIFVVNLYQRQRREKRTKRGTTRIPAQRKRRDAGGSAATLAFPGPAR